MRASTRCVARTLLLSQAVTMMVLFLMALPQTPTLAQLNNVPVVCSNCGCTIGTVSLSVTDKTQYVQNNPAKGIVAGTNWTVAATGSFTPANPTKCVLPPGYAYEWLQTVSSTAPIYKFQTANTTYMDRTRVAAARGDATKNAVADGSPFYRFDRQTAAQAAASNPLGFGDMPSRSGTLKAFSGTWTLYLVCAQVGNGNYVSNQNQSPKVAGTRNIMVISSYTWGFTVTPGANALAPSTLAVTGPTATTMANFNGNGAGSYNALVTAFTGDPDMPTFNNSWKLSKGCCCVPESSSWSLLLAGLVALPLARRRTRKVAA